MPSAYRSGTPAHKIGIFLYGSSGTVNLKPTHDYRVPVVHFTLHTTLHTPLSSQRGVYRSRSQTDATAVLDRGSVLCA